MCTAAEQLFIPLSEEQRLQSSSSASSSSSSASSSSSSSAASSSSSSSSSLIDDYDTNTLQQLIHTSLSRCDVDARRDLLGNYPPCITHLYLPPCNYPPVITSLYYPPVILITTHSISPLYQYLLCCWHNLSSLSRCNVDARRDLLGNYLSVFISLYFPPCYFNHNTPINTSFVADTPPHRCLDVMSMLVETFSVITPLYFPPCYFNHNTPYQPTQSIPPIETPCHPV